MTNEEIDKLITVLQEMKTPEPNGIEIPDCNFAFNIGGGIWEGTHPGADLKYGCRRTTEEAAKLASKRMIRVNRLSLLAHILGVEKEFVEHDNNCYLYQNLDSKKWKISCSEYTYHPERVYMTKEGIKSIAAILNNNEWDLESDDD